MTKIPLVFNLLLSAIESTKETDFEKYGIPLLQSLFTSGLVSLAVWLLQRKYQIKDDLIKEKNKLKAVSIIECEIKLFDIIKKVRGQASISSTDLITFSDEINTLRLENYLYLKDDLYKIGEEFADYLLSVSVNPSKRTKYTEDDVMKRYKKKFSS